jgi:hypothetical protein
MEILDMRAKNYEWNCLIPAHELSISDREYLGLSDIEDHEWVAVEGEFSVEWDEETPLISIESAYAVNGSKSLRLTDGVALMFEQEVEDAINHSELEFDNKESLTDQYYDDYKDSL